jgi:hypothetical protein
MRGSASDSAGTRPDRALTRADALKGEITAGLPLL